MANQKDTDNPVNQSKLDFNTCSRRKVAENVCEQVTIGFDFTSEKCREILKPITKRSDAKPKQMRITFDTQVKTALSVLEIFVVFPIKLLYFFRL